MVPISMGVFFDISFLIKEVVFVIRQSKLFNISLPGGEDITR